MNLPAAADTSMKMFSPANQQRLNDLLDHIGLPRRIDQKVTVTNILSLMAHDKKFVAGRNRFVLAKKIGQVKVVTDVPRDIILSSIAQYRV